MPLNTVSVAKAEWFLKPETQAVFACLNREGFEVRVAGGAVRNGLLDEPVHEVDFATTARPGGHDAPSGAGGKSRPRRPGLRHGTVTLIVNGVPFEVTTLRRDVETHGRYATVAFSDNWAEDAERRDFTMNALYAGSRGEVYDPLGRACRSQGARRPVRGRCRHQDPRRLSPHPPLLPVQRPIRAA